MLELRVREIAVAPAYPPVSSSSGAQTNRQGSTHGGGPNTIPAVSSVTATSPPTNCGLYFTGGSERSLNTFSQSITSGLVLAVVIVLVML